MEAEAEVEDNRVEIECPDCSNEYMVKGNDKMDIINRTIKSVLKCPQCRRWMFADARTNPT